MQFDPYRRAAPRASPESFPYYEKKTLYHGSDPGLARTIEEETEFWVCLRTVFRWIDGRYSRRVEFLPCNQSIAKLHGQKRPLATSDKQMMTSDDFPTLYSTSDSRPEACAVVSSAHKTLTRNRGRHSQSHRGRLPGKSQTTRNRW